MCYLLRYDDVTANTPTLNESLLRRMNIVRQVRFQSIGKAFCNNFVDDIAKTNGPIICRH